MRVTWLTALTFAAGIFAGPLLVSEHTQDLDLKQDADLGKRQYETQAAILDLLLATIQIETATIRQ